MEGDTEDHFPHSYPVRSVKHWHEKLGGLPNASKDFISTYSNPTVLTTFKSSQLTSGNSIPRIVNLWTWLYRVLQSLGRGQAPIEEAIYWKPTVWIAQHCNVFSPHKEHNSTIDVTEITFFIYYSFSSNLNAVLSPERKDTIWSLKKALRKFKTYPIVMCFFLIRNKLKNKIKDYFSS